VSEVRVMQVSMLAMPRCGIESLTAAYGLHRCCRLLVSQQSAA
jgi:hypothetical protein